MNVFFNFIRETYHPHALLHVLIKDYLYHVTRVKSAQSFLMHALAPFSDIHAYLPAIKSVV